MVFSRNLPSPSSIFSTYASMAGLVMMIKPMVNTFLPPAAQNYVITYIKSKFGYRSTRLTLIINDMNGTDKNGFRIRNELYSAAQTYLSTKISPDASKLRISRDPNNKNVDLHLSDGEVISDFYKGIELTWKYLAGSKTTTTFEGGGEFTQDTNWERFELSFDKKHRDLVLNFYVPYVEEEAKVIKNERRILKMYSYTLNYGWQPVNFQHPSTFEKMAMNNELKRSVVEDLDRFIKRKNFYERVGKAWKRGYLLYGPPGTGKTSLVAAMANYLKFDIYDLQLASVKGDADLRRMLLATQNSSILLIEDIDCSVGLPTRLEPVIPTQSTLSSGQAATGTTPLTLSGLLNCIDGLWSSCGNERIIIFTTNNKEKLEPALLRPGRMDMHIYMGHCGFEGFKTLASNYLGHDTHRLYPEIKHLLDGPVLTPAQVAEELMKNENADMALEGLVRVLKRKRSELEKCDHEYKKMKKLKEGDKRVSDNKEFTELS